MATSVGISYVATVLPGFVWAKCPRDNLGVMSKVALGDLLEDPLSGKEGGRGTKTRSMSRRKSSLALEKGCFKYTGYCLAIRGVSVLTGGTRNLNVCVGW